MENVKIITVAPELKNALPVIQELSKKNIVVSVGKLLVLLINVRPDMYKRKCEELLDIPDISQ